MIDQRLYDRILARVRKDDSGCWVWTGPAWTKRKYAGNRYGYISVWLSDKKAWQTRGTHRAMWLALHGPLPTEIEVCHSCDNPLCCNPDHLFLGTHKDNMADSRKKGRHFLSAKTHCLRGHPLEGDNLCVGKELRGCKTCETARRRMAHGWPEHLAFSMGKVPHGYLVDFETGAIVSASGRGKKAHGLTVRSAPNEG